MSHWIEHWDPENEDFWETTGKKIARKNLILSMFAEHIGFSVWVLWTIVVLNLGNVGIKMSLSELFTLTLVPNLIGSLLRLPYTLAVPKFGGRAWTTVSAALLLIPTLLLAVVVPGGWLRVQPHGTQFWVLLLCAATAGLGGGNFSSSMANISFFYPEKRKGFALGLNAAGGNLGVSVAQLFVPLAIIAGVPAAAVKLQPHPVHLRYAGAMWIPLILLAVVVSYLFMNSLTQAKSDTGPLKASLKHGHAWVMSVLYIGTFGSFIGFSFALPLVIKNTFPEFLGAHPFIATYLAGLGFTGALVGSLSRPLGGWLSDRIGGAKVTLGVFLGMVVATAIAISGVRGHSFGVFFASFQLLFLLSGIGNGSTYKMIPSIYQALGRRTSDDPATALDFKRQAAAVIGVIGAIGAFGGVLIQVVIRQASLSAVGNPTWVVPALVVFLVSYVFFGATTWAVYLRGAMAHEIAPQRLAAAATA
jgi:NNP family nitrate/nitrite transporter-like MFS transporter